MEEATTSSFGLHGGGGDGERGAGGKFRKPAARKPASTPYDRPPPSTAGATQSLAARRRDGGWWLSKLVDPAYRLISGGATRMFPSFFSRDHPSDAPTACDPQIRDSKPDAGIDIHQHTQNLGTYQSTGVAGPGKEAECTSEIGSHEKGKESSPCNDDKLCEIEEMLKGKTFTREELNRLTEILHSKVPNRSNVNALKKIASTDVRSQTEGPVKSQGILRKTAEEKQEDLNTAKLRTSTPAPSSTVPSIEVGASPIDIARAYMGSRTPDVGNGPKSIAAKDDRASLPHSDEFALNPYAPSPLPKPSTCWPGAVVQDQGGYLTPQSRRGGFGLHNFPRTPYSRTIYSKSKTKLDGGRYTNIPSTPLQQSQTPAYEQTKSRGPALNGSVGPIRRMREKFGTEAPRGPVSVLSSQNGPLQVGNSSISRNFLPSVKNILELGATSSASKFQSVDRVPCSSEVRVSTAAQRIAEHLNRHTPTPKEKSAELDLAVRGQKSASSEEQIGSSPQTGSGGASDSHKAAEFFARANRDTGYSVHKGQHQVRGSSGVLGHADTDVYGGTAGPSLDFKKASSSQSAGTNQMTVAVCDSSGQRDGRQPSWPLLHGQSNGKVASEMAPNKDSHDVLNQRDELPSLPPSSRTKRGLGSISIDKPDLGRTRAAFDANAGGGFTFPVTGSSNVMSEPPTPSVMPSFSAAGTDPSYSFGARKSKPPLVFSFPSTSRRPAAADADDASEIVFKFGSDEKSRASFSPVGENGICS